MKRLPAIAQGHNAALIALRQWAENAGLTVRVYRGKLTISSPVILEARKRRTK